MTQEITGRQVKDGTLTEDDFSTTFYDFGTYTPMVTLVGGTGNTTPVYTTNSGRHTKIGRERFVDVLLDADGGAEGAGTGQINVALPGTASANQKAGKFPCGSYLNNGVESTLMGEIDISGTKIKLSHGSGFNDLLDSDVIFKGENQNATDRSIRLKFRYEE